jgi:predicted nucleic acid-binding protein
MTSYCLDTDVVSAAIKPAPHLGLIRRAAAVPATEQFVTAITVGELVYGAARRDSASLTQRVEEVLDGGARVVPFDERAARIYGELRAKLEREGQPLAEPDLRIASIAVAHGLVLVTGNVRHFQRVEGLTVENWLAGES